MRAKFILSLDCEGKWGVADHLTPAHEMTLSSESLVEAYASIVGLLEEFDIRATFAFVGLFTLPADSLSDPQLRHFARRNRYLQKALEGLESSTDGWVGDWALAKVKASRVSHELGLHGVTHAPWTDLSEEAAREEMSWVARLPFAPTTFIFPRNMVAHTNIFPEYGISGYREVRPYGSRLMSLLSECDLTAKPDRPVQGRPVPIPPGYFVNWRSGPRNLVPLAVSRQRAQNLMKAAVRKGGVVHYWTHPENIASAPSTLQVLRAIIEVAARLRDRGVLEIETQADYCSRLIADDLGGGQASTSS